MNSIKDKDKLLKILEIINSYNRLVKRKDQEELKILLTIAYIESDFDEKAYRHEYYFRYLYKAQDIEDIIIQKTSWGLFQIMGSVLKEFYYKTDKLDFNIIQEYLSNIDQQVESFIKYFRFLKKKIKDKEYLILAWNKGLSVKDLSLDQVVNNNYYKKYLGKEKEINKLLKNNL